MSCHRTIIRLSAVLAVVALATGCGDGDSPSAPPTPEPARPTTVTVSPATHELTALGTTVQLSAEVRDQNAGVMAGATVTWTSSASSMATVDASGLVTAAGNGTATITASAGSASGSAVVTVMQSVASVEVSPSVDELTALGQTVQLTAEAFDENGEAVAGVEFSWESSDAAIATVDAGGLVTGVAVGTATIRASVGGAQGTAEITVGPNPDRAALVALYEATDGQNWVNSENWLTDAPLDEWYGVGTDSIGRVTELDLTRNGLTGELPASLGSLALMTVLRIGDNDLSGRLPSSLTKLSLTELHYAGTELCVPDEAAFQAWLGAIPSQEGTDVECVPLSDREVLEILYEETGGTNWTNSESWLTDAPLRDWYGVRVDGESRVTHLFLQKNNLRGPVPPELSSLSSLEVLRLQRNALDGPIPPELGHLSNLIELSLSSNQLSGPIPLELGDLSNLIQLSLTSNQLSGPIPLELGDLSNLTILALGANTLEGRIPPELGRLLNLERFLLWGNNLEGPIPPELGNLSRTWILSVSANNLSGPIPPELGNL